MLDQLVATIVASALQQAPGEKTSVRLQMLSTTDATTYVPRDIGPPTLGQTPTGLARLHSSIERQIDNFSELLETIARVLPIDREADENLGRHLAQLQSQEMFEPLAAVYDEG